MYCSVVYFFFRGLYLCFICVLWTVVVSAHGRAHSTSFILFLWRNRVSSLQPIYDEIVYIFKCFIKVLKSLRFFSFFCRFLIVGLSAFLLACLLLSFSWRRSESSACSLQSNLSFTPPPPLHACLPFFFFFCCYLFFFRSASMWTLVLLSLLHGGRLYTVYL